MKPSLSEPARMLEQTHSSNLKRIFRFTKTAVAEGPEVGAGRSSEPNKYANTAGVTGIDTEPDRRSKRSFLRFTRNIWNKHFG